MKRLPYQLGVGTLDLTAVERKNVLKVLDSNRLSYGSFSRAFEAEFAALHDCQYAVFMNSGTSALSLAVACLRETEGWKDGDEVIVPAITFVASANVVLEHGLQPAFVDCDPRTYNIDPSLIEAKITKRTQCIMVVHLFGLTADMDPILNIAKKHNLRMIEDSCETTGVKYKGRKTGSFGDISCFSTYIAHLVVTGVGGLAVTTDLRYAEILRSLANHGRDNIYIAIDDDKDIDGARFNEVIKRRFRFIRRGYSCRATEFEAAIGLGQLRRLRSMLNVRRKNALTLTRLLKPFEQFLQLPWYDASQQEHAFMMYPIVIRPTAPFGKFELVKFLEDMNVETRDMLPLINQPVYAFMKIRQTDYPVAHWVNESGFYIGCHQGLNGKQLQYVADVFKEFFQGKKLKIDV